jgi:3-dehydroquinate dehydratase / shikimate dehydrogenase
MRLVATIFESSTARALEVAALAVPSADLLEIRLDALADPDPARLVRDIDAEVILTCRPECEGGSFQGAEDERLRLLEEGIAAGAAFVDVEGFAAARLPDRKSTRLIVSHHDFSGMPEDLDGILDGLLSHRPDVAKLVTTAHGPEDVLRVLELLRRRGKDVPLAAHTMGAAGMAGRILAARFGSRLVYGAARLGGAAAPGQPTLRSLREDYALPRDLSETSVLLLLGGKLTHSISARMVNRTLRTRDWNAIYVPFPVADPRPIFDHLDELSCHGLAVTFPLKETIADLVTDLDPGARDVGAVNTVVRSGVKLTGHNTDVHGALTAIRREIPDPSGINAVVLGAGGAARAAAYGLSRAGAAVTLVNRTRERAARLAVELGVAERPLAGIDPETVSLLVNATPVGQWPATDESPVPAAFLRPSMAVLDMVYNPRETLLLRHAQAAGARTIPGLEMLAAQAERQLHLWLGAEDTLDTLRAEGARALSRLHRNLVLIGMRGAGKTTVGRILAERLDRPFVDLDQVIEADAGRSISDIFAEEGEVAFRHRERQALLRELAKDGLVLALGGGAVESGQAMAEVRRRDPLVVLLTAEVATLAGRVRGSGRPSLTGRRPEEEIAEVLLRREPTFEALAGLVVDTGRGSPMAAADRILDGL